MVFLAKTITIPSWSKFYHRSGLFGKFGIIKKVSVSVSVKILVSSFSAPPQLGQLSPLFPKTPKKMKCIFPNFSSGWIHNWIEQVGDSIETGGLNGLGARDRIHLNDHHAKLQWLKYLDMFLIQAARSYETGYPWFFCMPCKTLYFSS